MPITFRDYLPLARENEGTAAWMYLDTVGNVTVGIGHKLDTPTAAAALPFVGQDGERPAARDAVRAAFTVVRDARHLIGRRAEEFAPLTTIRLPQGAVRAAYERDFTTIVDATRALFRAVGGGLDSWPEPAQLAVIDMAFNLGPSGLFAKFPRFREDGLARRDFDLAARESHRTGVAEDRNARTRGLLLEAALIESGRR